MRMLGRSLLAFFVVSTIFSPAGHARQVIHPSIGFDSGQPVGGKGKITAAGTYSLGTPPHTFNSVTLYARLSGGGPLHTNICSSGGGSWVGLISPLPAGSYECWAVLRTTSGGNPVETPSVIKTVVVP
jgi:hypothetical protein